MREASYEATAKAKAPSQSLLMSGVKPNSKEKHQMGKQ